MTTAGDQVDLGSLGHDLLFTHAVLWGCGAIAAESRPGVRLGWTGELTKTPVLWGISATELAGLVRDRAVRASDPAHWVRAGLPHEPPRALFSPRIKLVPDSAAWQGVQAARRRHLDSLVAAHARLDLRLIAALGEPSSWHHDRGQPRQDWGASRLEMQPRNQGSEFVGTRLRSLAHAVARRSVEEVRDGLLGVTRVDEAGNDAPGSRSGANLMPPRVTDNALAWSAMWGLSTVPVVHRVHQPSHTATHLPWSRDSGLEAQLRAGHLAVPFWRGRWTVARLKAVLGSHAILIAADTRLAGRSARDSEAAPWLREQGVTGILITPIHTYGSKSSPERRAMAGQVESLVTPRP